MTDMSATLFSGLAMFGILTFAVGVLNFVWFRILEADWRDGSLQFKYISHKASEVRKRIKRIPTELTIFSAILFILYIHMAYRV